MRNYFDQIEREHDFWTLCNLRRLWLGAISMWISFKVKIFPNTKKKYFMISIFILNDSSQSLLIVLFQWHTLIISYKTPDFASIVTSSGGKNVEKPHPINVGDIMQKTSCWHDCTKVILMNFTTLCIVTMKILITMLNLFIYFGAEQEESMSLRRCITKSIELVIDIKRFPNFKSDSMFVPC